MFRFLLVNEKFGFEDFADFSNKDRIIARAKERWFVVNAFVTKDLEAICANVV